MGLGIGRVNIWGGYTGNSNIKTGPVFEGQVTFRGSPLSLLLPDRLPTPPVVTTWTLGRSVLAIVPLTQLSAGCLKSNSKAFSQ